MAPVDARVCPLTVRKLSKVHTLAVRLWIVFVRQTALVCQRRTRTARQNPGQARGLSGVKSFACVWAQAAGSALASASAVICPSAAASSLNSEAELESGRLSSV